MSKPPIRPRAPPHRRKFLSLAAGSIAGTLAMPAIVRAQAPIAWKLATAWPRDARGGGANAARLAELLPAMSGGRITVSLFAAGELAAPAELFDAVSAGTAEMGHGTSADWQVRDPAFHFFAGVPFGLSGHEHAAWLRFGGAQALWRRAYDPFGVVPFFAGSTGVPAAGWFRNPVATPDDLKNLPMRATGLSGEIWRRLGVAPVAVPLEEIVSAFNAQKIDAAEANGLWQDYDLGLATLGARCYAPGFRAAGPTLELIVNRAAFEALTDDLKVIVRAAAAATALETYSDFTYNNLAVMQILQDRGVSVAELPEEIVRAAGAAAETLLDEIAASSPIAREAYDSFVGFRRKAVAYAKAGDEAALRLRTIGLRG